MIFYIRTGFFITLFFSFFTHSSLAQDNGSDRGGGDDSIQIFRSAGREALEAIQRWQAQPEGRNLIPEYLRQLDATVMNEVINTVIIRHTPRTLRLRGETVHAINHPRRWLLRFNEPSWDAIKNDPIERPAFALHEFLAFYFYRMRSPLSDSDTYALTHYFILRLRREKNLTEVQQLAVTGIQEVTTAIINATRAGHEPLLMGIRFVSSTPEHSRCVAGRGLPRGAARNRTLLDCLTVSAMYEAVLYQLMNESVANRTQSINAFDGLAIIHSNTRASARAMGVSESTVEEIILRINSIVSIIRTRPRQYEVDLANRAQILFDALERNIRDRAEESSVEAQFTDILTRYYNGVIRINASEWNFVTAWRASLNSRCPGGLQEAMDCIPQIMENLSTELSERRMPAYEASLNTLTSEIITRIQSIVSP